MHFRSFVYLCMYIMCTGTLKGDNKALKVPSGLILEGIATILLAIYTA